jgi:tetratricopeptide (TPR) repeat protein
LFEHIAPKAIMPPADIISSDKELLVAGQQPSTDRVLRLELARCLSYLKRYEEAVDEYRRLLSEEPRNYALKTEFANVLHWQGDVDEVIQQLEAVPPELRDKHTTVLLGDMYVAKKNFPQAVQHYEGHLSTTPSDSTVRVKLAQVYSWMQDYPTSINLYQFVLKEYPEDKQVRRKYARVLSWAGMHKKAAHQLRLSLE